MSKAACTLGCLWIEGEASGTCLLINSVNWVGESGTSQPAGSVHQPTLTVWFEERPWVLRAVGETEAQVLWQRGVELGLRDLIRKCVKSKQVFPITGCGLGPLGRDSPFLPWAACPSTSPRLSLLLLKAPDCGLLLQPCQGPTLCPPGPALGRRSTATLHVLLPGGLSASHQTESSDRVLLMVGASVPGMLKMLNKFPIG